MAALICEFTLAIVYTLAELKSVFQISQTKWDYALPENEPFDLPPTQIRQLGKKGRPVREMK